MDPAVATLDKIKEFLSPIESLPLTTVYSETTILKENTTRKAVELNWSHNPIEILSRYRPHSIHELHLAYCGLTDTDLNTILKRQRRLVWLNMQGNLLVNPKLWRLKDLVHLNISYNIDFTGSHLHRINYVLELNVNNTRLSQDGANNLTHLSDLLLLEYRQVDKGIPDLNQVRFPPGIQDLVLDNIKFIPRFNFSPV